MKSNSSEKEYKRNFTQIFFCLKTLFILGSFVHLFSTVVVLLIGKYKFFPNVIYSNGTFVGDAGFYISRAEFLSQQIADGNLAVIFGYIEQIHLRIYSLSYYFFSGILGDNILTFEFVNLPLFLIILFLVFKIGQTLFGDQVGYISAYVVMLLPTFVLLSTQPLRDPLFIGTLLFFVWQLLNLYKKKSKVSQAIFQSLILIPAFLLLWFIREAMLLVYLGIILSAMALIILLVIKSRFEFKYNIIPIFVILVVAILTPKIFSSYLPLKIDELVIFGNYDNNNDATNFVRVSTNHKRSIEKFIESQNKRNKPSYLIKINTVRYGFSESYKNVGSNIDEGYLFDDTSDLLLYLPKAISIGFLSPFPNSWFDKGATLGKNARVLAGFETFFIYLIIILAVFAVFRNFNFAVLFIVFTVFIGLLAFGLVIINVGVIYRLRYSFWFLLIVLGVEGFFSLVSYYKNNFQIKTT